MQHCFALLYTGLFLPSFLPSFLRSSLSFFLSSFPSPSLPFFSLLHANKRLDDSLLFFSRASPFVVRQPLGGGGDRHELPVGTLLSFGLSSKMEARAPSSLLHPPHPWPALHFHSILILHSELFLSLPVNSALYAIISGQRVSPSQESF